jgi:fumarate reductase subunit D
MKRGRMAYRQNTLWIAAFMHRISGLLLALFLPLHFLVLGLAIRGEVGFESFLRWTDRPLVKFAESGLIFLLAVHLLGGLRVLAIETLPWRDGQKRLALVATATAVALGAVFLFLTLEVLP